MDKTYWNGKGKYQKLYAILVAKIPVSGSVANPEQNPALEKLRIASNCYYDLYNNGLCNRAKEFRKVFGFGGTKIVKAGLPYSAELETKVDSIVLDAAKEQKIITAEIIDINDAQHPSRQKAIKILEAIAEKLGNSWIFDNASQNRKDEPDGTWYEYEDMVTNIIEGEKNEQ